MKKRTSEDRIDMHIMRFVIDNFYGKDKEHFLKSLKKFLCKFPEKIKNPEIMAEEIVNEHYKYNGIKVANAIMIRMLFPEKHG